MRSRVFAVALIVSAITLVTAGCSAPDRSAEAAELESALRGVPGVGSADVSYVNGFDSGYTVSIDVGMSGADDAQVVAMVHRMNTLMGHDFDDYATPVSIDLGAGVRVESEKQLTPENAATVLATARSAQRRVTADHVTVFLRSGRIDVEIMGATDPVDAAGAVAGAMAAAIGPARGSIVASPKARAAQPRWTVTTPVAAARLRQLEGRIRALTILVTSVAVDGGLITELAIDAGTQEVADANVRGVIASLGADRAHPVRLSWSVSPAVATWERDADGVVSVGSCDYPRTYGRHADTDFEKAAADLEQRIRADYDTCRR
ncbi:hypothetical protein [Williamsia sp. CHRR-6]|uniref:hypothetical protein n=1 Tax=Williamsia sp. CHRR-6 TaxID=2835871 RepID=UPI001BDA4B86|nr:hypothetical protein [Williamsia sp. CHRR-6]MBT0567693.1 hypothetical protein [Williamsia sp. CHRR-6]